MADMQALAAAFTAAIQAATAAAAPPPNFAADLQTAVTNAINAAQSINSTSSVTHDDRK